MGLETLLEAAKFLEYKAEVEARGKSLPFITSLCENQFTGLYTIIQSQVIYEYESCGSSTIGL